MKDIKDKLVEFQKLLQEERNYGSVGKQAYERLDELLDQALNIPPVSETNHLSIDKNEINYTGDASITIDFNGTATGMFVTQCGKGSITIIP